MKALSIRQPWAWLIATGWKDIENRTWRTNFRGTFLIHASQGMTEADYRACVIYLQGFDRGLEALAVLPEPRQLKRGGIIGEAILLACVTVSQSPWFCGDYGFMIGMTRQLPFRPLKGHLNFFNVSNMETP